MTSAAAVGVEYCNRLFELERKFANLSSEERHNRRQAESRPVLDEFFAWLDKLVISGNTALSKAVQYAKNERKYLTKFLENGDIPIDNNRAESAIRPFCVGMKNWLFSASMKGADTNRKNKQPKEISYGCFFFASMR